MSKDNIIKVGDYITCSCGCSEFSLDLYKVLKIKSDYQQTIYYTNRGSIGSPWASKFNVEQLLL